MGSMTSKQLSAEMKGRGLSISGLNKAKMLKTLRSNISFEENTLKSHIDDNTNIDNIIENTKNSLIDFINYMKENSEEIRKYTKKETKQIINKNKNKNKKFAFENEEKVEET